ncbi:MAG: translocation/assembly module TamB domain-containing protein [Spirosomataceae bacterium]
MRKIGWFLGLFILLLIILVSGTLIYLKTPAGQQRLSDFVFKQASSFLKAPIEGRISYQFPDWILAEDFLLKDQEGDTLLYTKRLKVDIDMWALIRQNRLLISKLEASHTIGHIRRKKTSDTFNYTFLVDAFSSSSSDTSQQSMGIDWKKLTLSQTRCTFEDALLGNYGTLHIEQFTTGFSIFDLSDSRFHVLPTQIEGVQLDGTIRNWGTNTEDTLASSPSAFQIAMKPIDIHQFHWNIRDYADTLFTNGQLTKMEVMPKEVNLSKKIIDLQDIRAQLDAIAFSTNPNYTRSPESPYSSWQGKQIQLDFPHIFYSPAKSYIHLRGLSMGQMAQLQIRQLATEVTITPKKWDISSFVFQTKQSNLHLAGHISTKRSNLLQVPQGNWDIQLEALPSQLDIQEMALLYPSLSDYLPVREGKFRFYSELTGSLKNLSIKKAYLQAPEGILVDMNGQIKGLPDLAKTQGNFKFQQVKFSKGWQNWLPDSLVSAYHLPELAHFTGTLEGSLSSIKAQLSGKSTLGNVTLSGNWNKQSLYKPESIFLDGNVQNIALGVILKDTSLQTFTSHFTVSSLRPFAENRQIDYAIKVDEVGYQGTEYTDIHSKGTWRDSRLDFQVDSKTAQAGIQFDGTFDWSQRLHLQGNGFISHFSLPPQTQFPQAITLKNTSLQLDLTVIDPSKWTLQGFLAIPRSTWQTANQQVDVEQVQVSFTQDAGIDKMQIESPFMQATLLGNESFLAIPNALEQVAHLYFKMPNTLEPAKQKTTGSWSWQGTIKKHALFDVFVTQKIDFKPLVFQGELHTDTTRQSHFTCTSPFLKIDSLEAKDLSFYIQTTEPSARITASMSQLQQGDFRIQKAESYMEIRDNKADFRLTILDSLDKKIHQAGLFVQADSAAIRMTLAPKSVFIYYTPWESIETGYAEIRSEKIRFQQLGIYAKEQELSITSDQKNPTDWLIHAKNLDLKTLTTAFTRNEELLDGKLTTDITVRDRATSPTFVGDISIEKLKVIGTPIGDFKGIATNEGTESISINATLKSTSNDLSLQGKYALNKENPLDLILQIQQLNAETIQAFSFNQLRDASGNVAGRFLISGNFEQPNIEGQLRFNQFRTTINQTGTPIYIDKQAITTSQQQLLFQQFIIKDSLNNKLEIDGRVNYANFSRIKYDLALQTTDFLASNARRSDNELFYGTAFLDAKLAISGENEQYLVTGNMRVADKTRLTVFMPADEQVGSEMDQLITFVTNKKELEIVQKSKSKQKKTPVNSNFSNTGVTVNLQVSEQAELTIVMDELTGDNIKVRGRGQLTTGLDQNGEIFVLGKYTILEGTYRLTYQVFERLFSIDESSKSSITWKGDPMDAEIAIRAAYKVNKPLVGYPLTSKSAADEARLQASIPFSVDIVLSGELLAPQTEFALTIPKEIADRQLGSDLANRLAEEGFTLYEPEKIGQQTVNPKAEANKEKIKEQAIFMLMFGRFDLLGASLGQPVDAEGFARKQVSQLVSEQLDKLADEIIKGIDLDLGVRSESSADHRLRSTNVNVGVKKGFFNDRISVSVGKNFELESAQRQSQEIFDNITANYAISKDGRYRFKAFRTNQYQIEGFVVETGVGFVLTLDYDSAKEIFRRSHSTP